MSHLLLQRDHMRLHHACARQFLKLECECRPEVYKCSKSPQLLRLVLINTMLINTMLGRGLNITGWACDPFVAVGLLIQLNDT